MESREKKEKVSPMSPASSGEGKKPSEVNLKDASIKSHGHREAAQKANARESMIPANKKPAG